VGEGLTGTDDRAGTLPPAGTRPLGHRKIGSTRGFHHRHRVVGIFLLGAGSAAATPYRSLPLGHSKGRPLPGGADQAPEIRPSKPRGRGFTGTFV
jgi:hypothetical protein